MSNLDCAGRQDLITEGECSTPTADRRTPNIERGPILTEDNKGNEGLTDRNHNASTMKAILPIVALLVFSVSIASGQNADASKTFQPFRLRPVDQGNSNPGFRTFRAKLIDAIGRKDAPFLLSVVDPKIEFSFGGDSGLDAFRKSWKPEDPTSAIWKELKKVLELGGTFDKSKNEFWAPYVFSRFPEKYDGFSYSAIIASNVKVHRQPKETSAAVATLSYDIVQTPPDEPGEWKQTVGKWIHVRLPDGRDGFVHHGSVRSPIDYRAGFKKDGARWMMTHFIAGD